MIENFLIDPNVIWNAIVTVRHKTSFTSLEDVEGALDALLNGMRQHEYARRVKAAVGSKTFRLRDPIEEATAQLDEHTNDLRERLSAERLERDRQEAENQVRRLVQDKLRRERFDGKRILSEFFRLHMHDTGMSREIFIYELAREASTRRSVKEFVKNLFDVVGPLSDA